MVSAFLNDALSNPLTVLYSLQDSTDHESNLTSSAAAHFHAIFKDNDALKQIPPLDILHPPEAYLQRPHSLVRFRAMVQDTSPSPEIYPSLLRDGRPGGWGLAETVHEEAPLELQYLREREIIWAVSVPGESPLVAEHLDDPDRPASGVEMAPNTLRHKDPLLRENHVGVQIKIYDSIVASPKPTELRTFVGFLTLEPIASAEDDALKNSPVPTLHTLFSVIHPQTLVSFDYPVSNYASASMGDETVSSVRDELIQWIADEALGGDRDAAEWVLLICIARTQSRQPPLIPPSLTLSGFPSSKTEVSSPALSHILRHILPLLVDVPLSLPLLNERPFAPESHDESLRSGLLQLPAGTTVLLSDNGMSEGKITETGVNNIQALRTALTSQTLEYKFPFVAPYQFPVDLSFIFLTGGKRSAFVETPLVVPLECKSPEDCFKSSENIRLPSFTRLDAFRRLVGGAKTGKITVTEEVSQYIQDDFVQERQKHKDVTVDDLMTRMAVARLFALSLHDTELTQEVWQRAKDLDERRKRRS